MVQRVTRRQLIISGLMAGCAWPALAAAPTRSLVPRPRPATAALSALEDPARLITSAELGGEVGFAVVDLQSGEVLETHNPLKGLPPASVTKTITSLYALDRLGPAHRFRTRLIGTGPVEGGRLEGDLVLAGGGDPTLDTEALALLARRLREAGVHEVAGDFRYWGGALPYIPHIDGSQPDHLAYNPAVNGLNLNFNRVFFEWRRGKDGYTVTLDARTRNLRPQVSMARVVLADRAAPIYSYIATHGVETWSVAAPALGRKGGRWLPVRRPAPYAAEVFATLARSNGIALSPPRKIAQLPQGETLAYVESPPLAEILRSMLKYSTNLTAEVVGLAATAAAGRRAASLQESAAQMTRWVHAATRARHARFVDHSGLGEGSRISASEMARLLASAGWDGPLRPMLKKIDMRDARGRPVRNHPVQVHAKTGTLNFVSALAGYVQSAAGRRYAFAIFCADLPRRRALSRRERERPPGGRAWNLRAKRLQQQLIERWVAAFG